MLGLVHNVQCVYCTLWSVSGSAHLRVPADRPSTASRNVASGYSDEQGNHTINLIVIFCTAKPALPKLHAFSC